MSSPAPITQAWKIFGLYNESEQKYSVPISIYNYFNTIHITKSTFFIAYYFTIYLLNIEPVTCYDFTCPYISVFMELSNDWLQTEQKKKKPWNLCKNLETNDLRVSQKHSKTWRKIICQFTIYLTPISIAQIIQSRMTGRTANYGLENIWKKARGVKFEVLYQHVPGRKSWIFSFRTANSREEICIRDLSLQSRSDNCLTTYFGHLRLCKWYC